MRAPAGATAPLPLSCCIRAPPAVARVASGAPRSLGASVMNFYTDDSPGLKLQPVGGCRRTRGFRHPSARAADAAGAQTWAHPGSIPAQLLTQLPPTTRARRCG